MFRRRPFRRLRRPLLRGRRPLPPRVRQALIRANRLMAEGQFAEAGGIFEQLSEEANQRGMLIRAADLALQSSRAYFAASDVDTALEWARQALRLFVRGGRVGRVPLVLSKMTSALRQKGYDAQADQLEREATQALEEVGLSLDEARQRAPQAVERRGSLPARCAGCGAPLVPDEVEWHDAHTAECPYCGTVAKTC